MTCPMIDNFFKDNIQQQIRKIIINSRKNFPNQKEFRYMIMEVAKDNLLIKSSRVCDCFTDSDMKNSIVIAYLGDLYSHSSYQRLRHKYERVAFTCRPSQFYILFFSIPSSYLVLLKLAPREMRQSFLYNLYDIVRPLVIEDRSNLAQFSRKTNKLDTFALGILRKIRNQVKNDVCDYEYFEEDRFN